MFNSNVIDVAIGLVFVFLLLSLICSAANEMLESFLKQRAGNLERGIKELVGEDKGQFVADLYNHGLINSLYRGKYESAPWWKFWRKADLPSYIPARNFAIALMDLRTTTKDLPANVKSALDAFAQNAGADQAKLQRNIEDWFNSSMDRVSGWYKRRSQRIVLVMGLVAAVLVNADCIQIAKRLSTNAVLRNSVVSLANTTTTNPNAPNAPASAVDRVKADLQTLDTIGLPLGWYRAPGESTIHPWDQLKAHWIGWLITALAVSLGAPFWFDVLNKIIVIRSTVKPAEKSGPEASKDAAPPAPAVSPLTVNVPGNAAPAPAAPPPDADPGLGVPPPATDDGGVVPAT